MPSTPYSVIEAAQRDLSRLQMDAHRTYVNDAALDAAFNDGRRVGELEAELRHLREEPQDA